MIEQVKPTEYDTILNECRIKIGGNPLDTKYSTINWSNENGEATPNPFVLEHYIAVDAPKNLRLM